MLSRSFERNVWSFAFFVSIGVALSFIVLTARLAIAHDQEIEGGEDHAPEAEHLECEEGMAGEYPCLNMELVHFVPVAELGGVRANDIWGWTDPLTGEEYAILGMFNGTAFVHIDDHGHPTFLGRLPTRTVNSSWRDIKVYLNHAYIVSEAVGHGMQIFDLTRLRDVDPALAPITFAADLNYGRFGSAHNIAINEDTGYAYAVGAASCLGGLHMINIFFPKLPQFAGCYSQDRYTHDAQCVLYHGPDEDYQGREICFNSNEDTVTIVDVTDKSAPQLIARAPYFSSAYTHQGWLTEDHAYFLLDDELDERRFGIETRTFVWDMTDLDAPFVSGVHRAETPSIDHNQYVVGNHVFQANYRSGIRILRLGDLSEGEMTEVAYFDTTPADDLPLFSGTWSVYPFFESGLIIASDIHRGLYILHPHLDAIPECSDGIDNDRDGLRDYEDPTCVSDDDPSESIRFDVELAINPRCTKEKIVPGKSRNLRLAILGSDTVDVRDLDLPSLLFHPGDVEPKFRKKRKRGKFKDLDRDGDKDLPLKIRLDRANLPLGLQEVCMTGLISFDPFQSCVEVELLENTNESRKKGRGCRPRGASK